MKCRACMMGVAVALVAWVVSVSVRGAEAMFAGTNMACAHNGDGFSYTEVGGMRRADTALAVVPTSHALSSATTPIIYKECHGQDNAAFRAVGESVVAACSDAPIIYIGSQMQGRGVDFGGVGGLVAPHSVPDWVFPNALKTRKERAIPPAYQRLPHF